MNDLMKLCCLVLLYWTLCVTARRQKDSIVDELAKGTGKQQHKVRGGPGKIQGLDQHKPKLDSKTGDRRRYKIVPDPENNGLPLSNTELYINQNINNFEYTSDERKKFIQRFIINADDFNQSGIVILIIGEQMKIDTGELKKEVWTHYAKEFNALLIHVEHRFWGDSCPKMTFTNENLVYLNSEQALADFAMLIEMFKTTYWGVPKTTKWIAFGSGRSGTLAARLRLKYPHHIQAAVSASGPLLEIPNYNEFFDYVHIAFGEAVTTQIYKAHLSLVIALKDPVKSIELKKKFNLCNRLDVNGNQIKNEWYFIWTISTFLGALTEEKNYEMEGFYSLKKKVMDEMVSISSTTGDELGSLASSIKTIFKYYWDNIDIDTIKRNSYCLDVNYSDAVELYKSYTISAVRRLHVQLITGIGDRQTFYQRCIEFGQFRTEIKSFVYSEVIKLDFYTGFCQDVFGDEFKFINEALEKTEMFYGGKGIRAKRVIFVNKKSDPSSILNITESQAKDEIVVYNEDGASACDDDDPKKAVQKNLFYSQRDNIQKTLKEWLKV